MKQFIYLDIDMVNSIIAQSNKGLTDQQTKETTESHGKAVDKEAKGAAGGAAEGGLLKLAKVKGELSIEGSIGTEITTQSVLREIETKTLHDAAFDIAYEYISGSSDLIGQNIDIGSFIELNRVFDFVDFKYIDSLFSKDGFIEYIKKVEKDKIETLTYAETETLTREQRRKSGTIIKQEIKKLIDSSKKQYDDIADVIKIIKSVVPYNKMLVSHDGFLVPLEDKYFRDNPDTIGFKHGGDMACVGYITNVIGKDAAPDSNNIFGTLQHMVNEIIRMLIPTKEDNLFIVHPIAMYYGH